MKLFGFLISPMFCDFSHFYRHRPDFILPKTQGQNQKLEGMALMVHLEVLNRLRQEVKNLSGRHQASHTRHSTKLAEPFHPTNARRDDKCNLVKIAQYYLRIYAKKLSLIPENFKA